MPNIDCTVRSLDSAGPRPEDEMKSRSNSPMASARASGVVRSGVDPRRGAILAGASARSASQPRGPGDLDLAELAADAFGRVGISGPWPEVALALRGESWERARAHPHLKLLAPLSPVVMIPCLRIKWLRTVGEVRPPQAY